MLSAACIATHCNMVSAGPPPKDVLATLPELTDFDKLGLAGGADYQLNDSGYSKIQGTKPQSIGLPLNDSPAVSKRCLFVRFRCKDDHFTKTGSGQT
jgi:epoxide hydrolase